MNTSGGGGRYVDMPETVEVKHKQLGIEVLDKLAQTF